MCSRPGFELHSADHYTKKQIPDFTAAEQFGVGRDDL
jgi:hypothetical protein